GTAANQMLTLAVGWQMYDLTGSAWDLGLIGLYQFAPALLLTLWAGHVADRHHRGRIVAFCLAAQCVAALALMSASRGQWASRDLLLGVSLLLGSVRPFQMSAQQALTPALVPLALLQRAMAFSAAGMQTAIIGAPALGGLIFVAGADKVYATAAVLLALGCVLMARLRYRHVPPPREPVSVKVLLAGVRYIWQRKVVLGAVSLDLFAVLLGGATALLPMFARDILHVGPEGLGLLRGAPAVGALAVSIALSRWPLRRHVGRTLLVAVAVFGGCMVAFGLSTSFALSLAALAASGGADMISVVVRQTLVQLETPDEMRGRVGAVNGVFIGASNQLGEFESGATAALLGPVGSVVAGGIGTVLVALAWRRTFPSLAGRDRLELPAPHRPS
ncbi:MAG TPA: MFS transporter, partial [Ramlibacter sp.]|nr:MFS transporter [Ramlibacter sp.]